jgi:hypothetical protein
VIDAHAKVIMKIAGAVVAPRVSPRLRVMQSVCIDESGGRQLPRSFAEMKGKRGWNFPQASISLLTEWTSY